jgi:hypothetical protein
LITLLLALSLTLTLSHTDTIAKVNKASAHMAVTSVMPFGGSWLAIEML